MMDNAFKYNKNRTSILPSAGSGESVIVLRPQHSLYGWVFAVLAAGLVGALTLYYFLNSSNSPDYSKSALPAGPGARVNSTVLARDVELLKGQMNVLITGAMESKIQQLEDSLQSGIISRNDLTTVQELKEDLRALKAYSLQNATTTFGLIQEAGPSRESASTASLYSDELLREISNMKHMFYFSMASWGLALVIVGGAWMRGHYRLKQIQSAGYLRHRLLEKPKTGSY